MCGTGGEEKQPRNIKKMILLKVFVEKLFAAHTDIGFYSYKKTKTKHSFMKESWLGYNYSHGD